MPHLAIVSMWSYAWSVLSMFFTLGIAWYLLDRRWGVKVYRWLHDLWNGEDHKMPANEERGFLYKQSTNRKITVATLIAALQSGYMMWELGWSVNFLAELLIWVLEIPALLGGFGLGYWAYQFLLRRHETIDQIDHLVDGVKEMHPADIAMKAKAAGGKLFGTWTALPRREKLPLTPAPETKAPVPPPPREENPLEAIERFTKGGSR